MKKSENKQKGNLITPIQGSGSKKKMRTIYKLIDRMADQSTHTYAQRDRLPVRSMREEPWISSIPSKISTESVRSSLLGTKEKMIFAKKNLKYSFVLSHSHKLYLPPPCNKIEV